MNSRRTAAATMPARETLNAISGRLSAHVLGKVEDPAIGDDEKADVAVMSCLGCRLDAFALDEEQRHEPPFDRSRAPAQLGGDQLVDRPAVLRPRRRYRRWIAVRL